MNTDLVTGRFTTSVLDMVSTTRYRIPRPPVVYLHGVNGSAAQPAEVVNPGPFNAFRAIHRKGYSIAVPSIDAYWGNATGAARVTSAIAWARANMGATNAPAVLIGTSHGGGSALCYAAANPTLVACVVIIVPAFDYEALRSGNIFGLRASIDAAWGVTYPTPLPAGANPAEQTTALAGKPIQMWTASDDLVSINHAAFTSTPGMNVTSYNVGALGHSGAAVTATNPGTIADFVKANT